MVRIVVPRQQGGATAVPSGGRRLRSGARGDTRQTDGDARPCSFRPCFEPHGAAVGEHDLATEVEAEPRSLRTPVPVRVLVLHPEELLEDALAKRGRYARTLVADVHLETLAFTQ